MKGLFEFIKEKPGKAVLIALAIAFILSIGSCTVKSMFGLNEPVQMEGLHLRPDKDM